jgi:hypothetical protein
MRTVHGVLLVDAVTVIGMVVASRRSRDRALAAASSVAVVTWVGAATSVTLSPLNPRAAAWGCWIGGVAHAAASLGVAASTANRASVRYSVASAVAGTVLTYAYVELLRPRS